MKLPSLKIVIAFIPLCILSFPASLYATHLYGADIEWDFLGNYKYRVKVNAYDDCRGSGTLSNTRINYRGNCSGIKASIQTMSNGIDITPVCPGQCTGCDASCSFSYGIKKYELVSVIDVSQFKTNGCQEVTISWSQCCRTGHISTGGANQNFYIEAKMHVGSSSGDNSPKFNTPPFVFTCLGRDFVFDHGASDRDTTDSLVFSFSEPRTSAGGRTTWKSSFSHQKPVSYLGFPKDYSFDRFPFGIHLDSATGMLAFRPMKIESSLLAIKVEEFRNGVKIGETSRDVTFSVIKCVSNNPPVISSTNCTFPKIENILYTCPGQEICFSLCTSDKDKNDTLSLEKVVSPPGSTVKITNGKRPKLDFCWTPTASQMRKQPYFLSIKTTDDACPLKASSFRTFQIFVDTGSQFKLRYAVDTLDSLCGKYRVRVNTKDGLPNSAWEWYRNDTVLLDASYTSAASSSIEFDAFSNGVQNISVRSTRGGCWSTFKTPVTVTGVNPIIPGSITDTTANCLGARLNMRLKASGGSGPLKYQWYSLDLDYGIGTTTDLVQAIFRRTGSAYTTTLSYKVTDSNNCSVDASFKVNVPDSRVSDLVKDTLICSDTLLTALLVSPNSNGSWSGKGVINNEFSSVRSSKGIHVLTYFEDNSQYCLVDTAIFTIEDYPTVSAGNDFTSCRYHTGTSLSGIPTNGTWSGSFVSSNSFKPQPGALAGQYPLVYSVSQNGCVSSDTLIATIADYRPKITLSRDTILCKNATDFKLVASPPNGKWSGRYLINKPDGIYFANASAEVNRAHQLTYYFEDSTGCYNVDTLLINVRNAPSIDAGIDAGYCVNAKNPVLVGNPQGGTWNGKNIKEDTILIDETLLGTNTYTYTYTDAYGCTSIDHRLVSINPLPKVVATPSSVCLQGTIKFHKLTGTPNGGNWTGPFIQSHIPAPTAKLTRADLGEHQYRYMYTDKNGCSGEDSMVLLVGESVTARFTKTTGSGALPITVDFTSTSTIRKGKYSWDFGDGSTSTDENPSHDYTQDGTYNVCLSLEDSTGYCTSSICTEVVIKSVGIDEFNPSWIEVYPNPTSHFVTIKGGKEELINVAVFDKTGKQLTLPQNGTEININVVELSSGYYIVKGWSKSGNRFTAPLIKK